MKILWDLSESHTMRDVNWPNNLDAVELRPIASVEIDLPQGRAFHADDDIRAMYLNREGDEVRSILVKFEKATTEAAYERAVALAREWDLQTNQLDSWFAERKAQRAAGDEDLMSTTLATNPDAQLTPGVPDVSLEILYSFDDELPSYVAVEFFWPPDRMLN
ncbi:MAG: hypothetical protein ACRD0K_19245 [Egibacteraceae bacterium]